MLLIITHEAAGGGWFTICKARGNTLLERIRRDLACVVIKKSIAQDQKGVDFLCFESLKHFIDVSHSRS